MTNIPSTPKNKVVMLVDDNTIDNFINKKVVINSSFTENVYVHTNAQSALEFLKNIENFKTEESGLIMPSYIFLDIDMPVADGYYFLEEFNKLSEKIVSEIKIVMLTSSLNPNDEKKSNAYGNVVRYLSKPLTVESLMSMN